MDFSDAEHDIIAHLKHAANDGNRQEHLNAVKDLSIATKSLSNDQVEEMAKSLKMHTLIGLARLKATDLRLFLSPPLPTMESSIPIEFWTILSKVPSDEVHQCIKHVTDTAVQGEEKSKFDQFLPT